MIVFMLLKTTYICNNYVYVTVNVSFARKYTSQQWLSGRTEGWGGRLRGCEKGILLLSLDRRGIIT